jgi:hypothetical protein
VHVRERRGLPVRVSTCNDEDVRYGVKSGGDLEMPTKTIQCSVPGAFLKMARVVSGKVVLYELACRH